MSYYMFSILPFHGCCQDGRNAHGFLVHFRPTQPVSLVPRKAVEMDRQLALQENMEAQQELRESLGG